MFLDYVHARFADASGYQWLFDLMREAVAQSSATEVHAHLAPFDLSLIHI